VEVAVVGLEEDTAMIGVVELVLLNAVEELTVGEARLDAATVVERLGVTAVVAFVGSAVLPFSSMQ
jgi:hypothetical protein